MNQSPIESHRRKLINLFYLSDLLPLSNMNSSDRRTTKDANFFFSLFTPVLLGQRFNKAQRGYEISDPQHPLIPQENMKVLSKSSRGAFEPIPLLFLHDLISRQTHLTRIPQTEPGGEDGDTPERGRRGSGGGAFPPPKGLRPSELGKVRPACRPIVCGPWQPPAERYLDWAY